MKKAASDLDAALGFIGWELRDQAEVQAALVNYC
jgi:hypothetical protein